MSAVKHIKDEPLFESIVRHIQVEKKLSLKVIRYACIYFILKIIIFLTILWDSSCLKTILRMELWAQINKDVFYCFIKNAQRFIDSHNHYVLRQKLKWLGFLGTAFSS